MKRLAFALALVAMAAACQRADQQPAQGETAADTTHMMGDTSQAASDTAQMMAGDTAKKM